MSNATETLKKVKAVLGLEVKMEQLKMENGTILEADKFEVGEPVFIVTEDEKVALPIGSEVGLTQFKVNLKFVWLQNSFSKCQCIFC